MHRYQDLKVWEKAIELVVEIYKLTADFPKDEKYGLTSQMRRSALSTPSNIAEGAGRNHDKEFVHFLAVANGSSFELETQIIVASKLELIADEKSKALCVRLSELQKNEFQSAKAYFRKITTLISILNTHYSILKTKNNGNNRNKNRPQRRRIFNQGIAVEQCYD